MALTTGEHDPGAEHATDGRSEQAVQAMRAVQEVLVMAEGRCGVEERVVRPVRRVDRYGRGRIRKVASGSFPREAAVRKK